MKVASDEPEPKKHRGRPPRCQVREHLLTCERCREHVTSIDNYHAALKDMLRGVVFEVHATEDGLIHQWVQVLPDGRCRARHMRPLMDGPGSPDPVRRTDSTLLRVSSVVTDFNPGLLAAVNAQGM
jgi:anti-sigma factor RsiW